MNHYIKMTTLAAVTLALFGGVALAENDRRGGLRAMDTDNNRSISLEEFQAAMTNRFQEFDSNSDGTISRDELSAISAASDDRRVQARAARVRAMDANWDGQLTMAEVQAASMAMFEQRDVNNDGQLDRKDRRGKRDRQRGDRS
ncbi:MAG: hypothetical protein AAFY73_13525 [Pseudomonadota bacterium]